ncbi:type II secretion system protein GspK [Actinomycetes bacterium KLBMP 9797]
MSTMPDHRPRPTLGWRIRHSWWLLLSIFGVGCLNGLGFLYVGLRARRPDWWIPGIVYLVAGWVCFLFGSDSPADEQSDQWWISGLLAVWFGSLLHAGLINSAWLRWRAGYVPWHAQPPAPRYGGAGSPGSPPGPPGPPGPAGLPGGLAPPPGHYYGPGPAAWAVPPGAGAAEGAASAGAAPTAGPSAAPDAAPSAAPVDVNTAGPEQLAALPSFDPERVRRVLAEREVRRGFGSVEEFAAAASLPPHEFVRVRGLVVCGPARLDPPPPGRILDV